MNQRINRQNRQMILEEYKLTKNSLQDWLITTDRLLKQQPNELTILSCEQVLNEQSIRFYSSPNLQNLCEKFELIINTNRYSSNGKSFSLLST